MHPTDCYSVLIIDDHPLFRKGVSDLLNSQPDFQVIGESASGEEGIKLSQDLKPDLVTIDLNMKGLDGVAVVDAISNLSHNPINIIMTVSDTEENLMRAIRHGADGYLLKDSEPELIIEKLRKAMSGEVVIDDSLTNLMANSIRDNKAYPPTDHSSLSEREMEIIKLIVKGMSNKLIARELGITEGTVKVHVKNMLRKLNLRSRLEAALWAIKYHLTE
jgi:two-component system nitrate/nitrite response regulator NarL